MKAFCKEMNIPFTEKLIRWDTDGEDIMHKWMIARENALNQSSAGIHKNMFSSTGFQPPSDLPHKSELDEDIVAVAEISMQYYEAMYKERLIID